MRNLQGKRGAALVQVCIDRICEKGGKEKAVPMSVHRLHTLLCADGKAPPDSLRTFLAFDASFRCLDAFQDIFYTQPDHTDELIDHVAGKLIPVSLRSAIEKSLAAYTGIQSWQDYDKVHTLSGEQVTSPEGLMHPHYPGTLYRLPNFGDQEHFLCTSVRSASGEIGILGMEYEGKMQDSSLQCLFHLSLKYPAFDLYLAHQCGILDDGLFTDPVYIAECDTIERK